jgi:predicted peroxiredoxin
MASKMAIFCGTDDPFKAFPPFLLGAGAIATEMELTMFFTFKGLNIVRKGGADKIVLPGVPKSMPDFLKIVRDGGARLIACSAAFSIVGMNEDDLIDGVECGGVATFLTAAEKADVVLTFC